MNEEGIVVLSLFDGMSCGCIALERAGINVAKYFASEIDKYAIKVSQHNYSDIIHIGDVTKVSYSDGILTTENGTYGIGKIDLLIAGSPCQGFSMAGKMLAFDDPRSKLYFEFERIWKEVLAGNINAKFLLENVKMKQEHKDVISTRLNVNPVEINSSLLSAQNRYRLYWTNIPGVEQPEDKGITLPNIIAGWQPHWEIHTRKPFSVAKKNQTKAGCLTALKGGDHSDMDIIVMDATLLERTPRGRLPSSTTKGSRRYTPEECEMLQTVPVGYTSCVSATQRYTMLGNGWTVDVIAHILQGLKQSNIEKEKQLEST